MKKPNLQRLAQRSKIYLRKASPTILSGLGAAGVIVTSVLAVRATPKALRKSELIVRQITKVIQRLIANLKLLNRHGSAIFRRQSAVRQLYSVYSVQMY